MSRILRSSPNLPRHPICREVLFIDDDNLPRSLDFKFNPCRTLQQTEITVVQMGIYSETKLCVRKEILKMGLSKLQLVRIQREVQSLATLVHPNIVKLYNVNEDSMYVEIFLEYCSIGDLNHLITARGCLSEQESLQFFFQILSAVRFIHSHGLVHRDLKPENILLSDPETAKIADFGFCTPITDKNETSIGTFHYAAPEILMGRQYIGPEVDAWSMGCILFVMLHGTLPFTVLSGDGFDFDRTIENMKRPVYLKSGLSADTYDLLRGLLTFDPDERMTLKECSELMSSSSSEGMHSARSNYSKSSSSLSSFPDSNELRNSNE